MSKRILLVTDSVSMPRKEVAYQETYVAQLEALYPNLWLLGGGGGERLMDDYRRVENSTSYLPQGFFAVGIIQLGIIDCAPRPLPYQARQIVSMLPEWQQKPVIKTLHWMRPVLVRVGCYQFTPQYPFEQLYSRLLQNMSGCCSKIIVIGIPPARSDTEKRSPGIGKQISLYNEAIGKQTKSHGAMYLSLAALPDDCLTGDVHILPEGHRRLWDMLSCLLNE